MPALHPVLFITINFSIELYADETLLYFASKNVREVEANLTSDLDNVLKWPYTNSLTLNLSKTKVMLLDAHHRLFFFLSFFIYLLINTKSGEEIYNITSKTKTN